ncbi:Helix loop helix DNA-binding domain protein [Heracleum sosnowskyi]|uniref:Helix loop helix DNA-binding domain protein n=1 Tax=Heracleum sosnowskyi TaxID=360622 RepID=A0AAD8MGK7_9APIA|nr:Helix loop helix DNA-binding domain protein [Heracleum sosnowskyi]
MGRGSRQSVDHDSKFKSPNLLAERKRREKLDSRLLELRALVPKITDMTKPAIITDAISYIHELKSHVQELSDQIIAMEATINEHEQQTERSEIGSAQEMENWGIEPEVNVSKTDTNKLWIKLLFHKTRGGFTKIIEGLTVLGFVPADLSVTTLKGAVLLTSHMEVMDDGMQATERIQELLFGIITPS